MGGQIHQHNNLNTMMETNELTRTLKTQLIPKAALIAYEYINDFRMEKAKYLLTHSDAPVTEIAMQVGFNSTSYFIKKFQQSNKVSPHKYRKSMRQI